MKRTDDIKWARIWLGIILGLVTAFFVVLIASYASLLVNDSEGWKDFRSKEQCYLDTAYGDRGSIYDCQGRLIQATFPYYTVEMDLRVDYLKNRYVPPKSKRDSYHDTLSNYEVYADSVCVAVSDYFKQHTHAELRALMDEAYRRHCGNFKIVSGKLNYKQLKALKSMPLFNQDNPYHSGLLVKTYENRENLYGNLAWRVIGAVFGDRTNSKYARFGIEEYFNDELAGVPGVVEHRAGSYDRPIERPIDGLDVVTTLDMDIQDKCESLLKGTFSRSSGDRACMILMEVKTGEIKAMVNLAKDSVGNIIQGENFCLSYRAEPGSTIKPIALLAMLEDGTCDTAKRYDVEDGTIVIPGTNGNEVKDSHFYERYITPKQIITWSSNCGMVRIALEGYKNKLSGWRDFYDAYQDLGITHKIDLTIHTEAEPIVFDPDTYKKWSLNTMPSMAYGYEIMMTPLYTLNFYNAIANDGYYVRPHIVRELRRGGEVVKDFSVTPSRKRIASKENIKYLQECLLEVVENPRGTAYVYVRNDQVRIAGKTGTATIHGTKDRNMVTFAGYFPADNPKYSAIVIMGNNLSGEGAPSRCGAVVRDIARHLMINY